MACGRPADASAKPWWLVWDWYVWSVAEPLEIKEVVSKKAKVGGPETATRYCQALKDKIVLTVLETVKFHDE